LGLRRQRGRLCRWNGGGRWEKGLVEEVTLMSGGGRGGEQKEEKE